MRRAAWKPGYAGDLVNTSCRGATRSTSARGANGCGQMQTGGEVVPSLHELCSRVINIDCYLSPKTICAAMDFAKAYNVPMLQQRIEVFATNAWAGVQAVHEPKVLQQGDHRPMLWAGLVC